jgi:hypothetical protein
MQMMVAEGVILVKPLTDGKDYSGGDRIDLEAGVALDWHRRGWVVPAPPLAIPAAEPVARQDHAHRLKGLHG